MPTTTRKKRPQRNSLTLRLVLLQIRRVASVLLLVDVLLFCMCAISIIIQCENTAEAVLPPLMEEFAQTGELPPAPGNMYSLDAYQGQPGGFRIDSNDPAINNAKRSFWRTGKKTSWRNRQIDEIYYTIEIQSDEPGVYYRFGIDVSSTIYTMLMCFYVILIVEAVLLISTGFRAQSSTRDALEPIFDLTQAARYISSRPDPIAPKKGMKLDETIDALNAITGENLSKRISLEDEREELQGLAQAINSMLERLDAAYNSQLRFVSDASHELRTPIAVIQGYANLLDRWGKEDEQTLQEAIDAIKSEAENMKELMEQLLFLARSDNQSIPLDVVDVNLSMLIEEVGVETRLIDSGHTVTEQVEPDVVIQGDSQLIKQAIRIIVDNSIKYTQEGGSIRLRVFREDGYAKVSVTDEGAGISEEDLFKVFDRFFRADDSRARHTGGTGLGLSIANWIVEAHDGYIEVTSRNGVGTRMTLAFPEAS